MLARKSQTIVQMIPRDRHSQRIAIPEATEERSVWLRVGTLLNGFSSTPLRNAHIVYDKNSILYVGGNENPPPANVLNPARSWPDLELPDFTLLPGLIESHAHLFLEGAELDFGKRKAYLEQSSKDLLANALERLEKLVRIGIIAVRDAGDRDGVGLALSKLYQKKDRPLMPYIDSPGAAIHHRGRYGSFMADPIENHDSLEACVRSRVQAGADRIKVIPTGIINFKKGRVTSEPQMTTEEVSRLVRAANAFGKQTFAHASGDDGIERAIEGGVDSIEHGFFIRYDQLARMRDRQIAWAPTFAPVQEQVDHAGLMGWDKRVQSNLRKILDQHAASLIQGHEMGVRIIAGSDAGSCGVAHGLGLLYEMELMERAGLSSLAVLHAATGNSSKRLAFKENFGRIKPGYRSRFLLTRHSPLESVSNLRKQRYVVFDGAVFENDGNTHWAGL